VSDSLPWLLAALCAAALLAALLGWWFAATRVRRHNMARQTVAQAGESAAERLLADEGFTVLDRQVTRRWAMHVDGEPHEVACRADLLVGRDGLRYVAEVKTGERASDPRNPATRRQLLEYRLVFPVDGVLLVDMSDERVVHVEFPSRSRGGSN